MQTKQQIRQLLASVGASPNKRLGQHFLIDLNLIRLLLDSADISSSDIVLEVGCATGSLTEGLAARAGKTIAVELDANLAKIAARRLSNAGNVVVINTDILEKKSILSPAVTAAIELARRQCSGRLLLVANLPYSVACPVMLNLVTGPVTADAMYVTVQKQVADRMVAAPGTSDYGLLSIFLNATGQVRIIRILKPTVFWPPPRVNSAMVAFVRDGEKGRRIQDMVLFGQIVDLFMGHRRKMLKTCTKLASGRLAEIPNWLEILESCSVDPSKRPDRLSPDDYVAIANSCARLARDG